MMGRSRVEPSVGSKGDSYANALAEMINRLYTAELIHRSAPWKTVEASSNLTRAPTDGVTSHISFVVLRHRGSPVASLVIGDSAAMSKYAQFWSGDNINESSTVSISVGRNFVSL